jgi:hypothetical protein
LCKRTKKKLSFHFSGKLPVFKIKLNNFSRGFNIMMSFISENQIGFKAKNRTADHLFSLKTIIDQYKIKKKKVFAAFIDLRKAFDTIWRVGLFYKYLKSQMPKKTIQYYIIHVCKYYYQNNIFKRS